jgi:diacylglycerol kinase (ATP)
MLRKIAFIVNPKAGIKKKIHVPEFIRSNISAQADYEIFVWDKLDRIKEIREKIFEKNFSVAVAVGGDGTVNEVAKMVNNTEIALGVLPFGSGNGLARSIGVSMRIEEALKQIENGTVKVVDSGLINGKPFFCTAGIGFDAHIGRLFSESKTRGFKTYFKITSREFFSYKPLRYEISVDGKTQSYEAFLITVGNAGQWGNDVFICPEAVMDDGILHLTVLENFPKYKIPGIVRKLFGKKIHNSAHAKILSGREIIIRREKEGAAHYDGEPDVMGKEIKISIVPKSLKVIS